MPCSAEPQVRFARSVLRSAYIFLEPRVATFMDASGTRALGTDVPPKGGQTSGITKLAATQRRPRTLSAYLRSAGLCCRVLRFWKRDIRRNLIDEITTILAATGQQQVRRSYCPYLFRCNKKTQQPSSSTATSTTFQRPRSAQRFTPSFSKTCTVRSSSATIFLTQQRFVDWY